MNDKARDAGKGGTGALDAAAVRAFHDRLDDPIATDDLLEEARALAEMQHAISARLARLAVQADEAQQARDVPRGINGADTTRLVGTHIGFARRCSPRRGAQFLHLAHALVEDMFHTLAALAAGVISEQDATRVVRETEGLSRADRVAIDAWIADDLGRVSGQRLATSARRHAQQIAPGAVRARRVKAESQRRVSLRPAPDSMAYLTALLPVKDGLACMAALENAAKAVREAAADGCDVRSRGQVMADTLVERLTGRSPATGGTDVQVNLLMPWDSLTGDTPAHVPGYGPVSADLVRDWFGTGDPTGPLVRRLFTQPGTGDIVGMESRARRYPGLLAWLIRVRDDTCRTPWCTAPIRHTDHIRAHATGGRTSERNGQGLCERCNYDKEHPDYEVTGTAAETIITTGGFTLTNRPPAPPGLPLPTRSYIERSLIDITWHHHVDTQDRAKINDSEDGFESGSGADGNNDEPGWPQTCKR